MKKVIVLMAQMRRTAQAQHLRPHMSALLVGTFQGVMSVMGKLTVQEERMNWTVQTNEQVAFRRSSGARGWYMPVQGTGV